MNDSSEDALIQKQYECPNCGSIYKVVWDSDEVDTAFPGVGPEFCPFCGETVEAEELPENILDMDFTDHAKFGRGVDLVDGEEE